MGEILRRFVFPKYRGKIVFGTLCKTVEVVFDLITPVIVASMIDVGVTNRDQGYVVRMCAVLIVLALVGFCFTLVCQKMAAVVSQSSGTDIRHDLYAKVNQLAPADLDRIGTPSLVTRITNDVNQVQVTVALGIRQIIRWPILAIGSMVCAMLIDAQLGLVFLVSIPAIAVVFWLVMSRSVPLFGELQACLDEVSLVTRENLSGVRVVRAFRQEGREDERFHKAADDQTQTAVTIGKLSSLLNPATLLVMDLAIVAILWMGGARIDAGNLTQGEVIAFVNYMTQMLVSIVYVANLVITINRGTASAKRIMEVLDCEPQISDEDTTQVELAPGTLTSGVALALDHVCFNYDGAPRPAVDNVTLRLGAGGSLGIIGGTGSGKSSLVNLIPRLYDATAGEVRVSSSPPCPSRRRWSRVPSARTSAGAIPTQRTWNFGARLSLRRPRTSYRARTRGSMPLSRQAARTSREASASVSPSRAPSWDTRALWCLMTPPRRLTSVPTQACASRSAACGRSLLA